MNQANYQRIHQAAAKKRKRNKPKSWLGRQWYRMFSPRNIIIISEHKTEHVPLSIRKQVMVALAVLLVVGFGSYFTGDYMAAQETLRQKEKMIANSHLKNRRIESEFALLKRDLVSMLDSENPDDLGEYAQFVIEQYRENNNSLEDIEVDLSQLGNGKHGAVFERIAFLERTVEMMKEEHETVMAAIEETAQGKLKNLEDIVRLTGLKVETLEKNARAEVEERLSYSNGADEENPRGGPYDSVNESLLKSYNSQLYSDLKRMVVLDEVVSNMPLFAPMKEYRITSGYGVRIDPIRKRPAHHHGLDFAGPYAAEVLSSSAGKVVFSGRKGAYGNMVEVDHGYGLTTRYGHLQKTLVKKGEKVKSGQAIGLQGNTGRSTGAHLHYEVRYRGATIDPKKFIKAGNYVRQIEKAEAKTRSN